MKIHNNFLVILQTERQSTDKHSQNITNATDIAEVDIVLSDLSGDYIGISELIVASSQKLRLIFFLLIL